MKSPITGKEMKLESKDTFIKYRGVDVLIPHVHFKCLDSGEEFTTESHEEANIWNARQEYESIQIWKWAEKAFVLGYLNQELGEKHIVDVIPVDLIPKWERCQEFLISLGCLPKPYKK